MDDIDVWVGALCEDHRPGAMVGGLLQRVFVRQFRRLREGDRYWYERVYRGPARERLERTTLADVIRRNTGIAGELSDRVMVVEGAGTPATAAVASARAARPPRELAQMFASRFFR